MASFRGQLCTESLPWLVPLASGGIRAARLPPPRPARLLKDGDRPARPLWARIEP